MTISRQRQWLFGALAAVGTAFCLPQTGWLARQQATAALGKGLNWSKLADTRPGPVSVEVSAPVNERLAAAIRSAPVRLNASGLPNGTDYQKSLRELAVALPDNPAVRASILRFECMGPISLGRRPENYAFEAHPKIPPAPSTPPTNNQPERVAEFRDDAARGAALEPDNVAFPLYSAMAAFIENDDERALSLLHFAATRARFDDHVREEAEGTLALSERLGGRQSVLAQSARSAAILFPHYAQMRATARIAVAKAVEKESAGDFEGGFAIRSDVRRIGNRMAGDASSYIGNLVGLAIEKLAVSRPGGAPAPDWPADSDSISAAEKARREQWFDAQWAAYTTRIHHPDVANWAADTRERRDRGAANFAAASESSVFDVQSMGRCALWFVSAGAVLMAIVLTLTLGGLNVLLARMGPAHNRQVRWGVAAALVPIPAAWIGLAAKAGVDSESGGGTWYPLAFGIALLLVGVCVGLGARGAGWRSALRTLGVAALTLTALGLPALGLNRLAGDVLPLMTLFQGISSDSATSPAISPATFFAPLAPGALAWLLALTLPLAANLLNRKRGTSRAVATPNLVARWSLPIATVLAVGYVAVLVVEARIEVQQTAGLHAMIRNEAAYIKSVARH